MDSIFDTKLSPELIERVVSGKYFEENGFLNEVFNKFFIAQLDDKNLDLFEKSIIKYISESINEERMYRNADRSKRKRILEIYSSIDNDYFSHYSEMDCVDNKTWSRIIKEIEKWLSDNYGIVIEMECGKIGRYFRQLTDDMFYIKNSEGEILYSHNVKNCFLDDGFEYFHNNSLIEAYKIITSHPELKKDCPEENKLFFDL